MYRSWSGYRCLGGKMLKKSIALLGLLLSFNLFACWNVEGEVAVDGETYKINQKFVHNKEYSLPMGSFIFSLKIVPGKSKTHEIKYKLVEKKKLSLVLITQGDDEITEKTQKEIFAKGEEGQPNSIITIKITDI